MSKICNKIISVLFFWLSPKVCYALRGHFVCVVLSLACKVSASGPPLRAQVATKADFAPLPHVIPGYNQHPLQQQRLWPRTANFSAIRRHRVMRPCLLFLFAYFFYTYFLSAVFLVLHCFLFPFRAVRWAPTGPAAFGGFCFVSLRLL